MRVPMKCSLLFTLLFLLSITRISISTPIYLNHFCSSSTSFAPNTEYHTNLNTLLHSLSANATTFDPSGFYTTATNKTTSDTFYGQFLCRGDQNATACRDCVDTATSDDLPNTYCPNRKVAVIWYDECMVRYSDKPIYRKMEDSPTISLINNQEITGSVSRFTKFLNNMMNDMAEQASRGDKFGRKFATNETKLTSLSNMYVLVECTPDLSVDDCKLCLSIAIGRLPIKQGATVLQPSCRVRYDNYPFYVGAVDLSMRPPPPPSPVISNSTNKQNNGPINGKKRVSRKIIIIAIVGSVILVAIVTTILITWIILVKKNANTHVAIENGEDFTDVESLHYDFFVLKFATNNFSDENKLGEGGFGAVYKGILLNGQEVAVKRLSTTSRQGTNEFKNEVLLLAKLQHRNLVRLLGFCLAGEEKLLVYEYVPNKSLDYFLFDQIEGQLNWKRRYNIIGGIVRGMLYLHHDSRLRIIHRDLKASNILLDSDMNPKIADFGTARIVGVDQSQINTNGIVGTWGYLSPEYAMYGQFSIKSDVYSFGVLVLEIISGKKNNKSYDSDSDEGLLSHAWRHWKDRTPLEFVDPTLKNSCSSIEVMRCLHLGLLCVQESVDMRPTMAKVIHMLVDNSVSLPVPEEPGFSNTDEALSNLIVGTGFDHTPRRSINNISTSEVIEPR